MDQLVYSVKSFFAYRSDRTIIDNFIFRLHYQFTVVVLICFCLLVTGRQYINDPMHCIPSGNVPSQMLNTFCWIHTTFSVEESWFKKVGKEVPYPGVANLVNDTPVYHAYYQWVGFIFSLQAVMFYFPHYLWKNIEGGRLKNLVTGLNNPLLPDDKRDNNRKLLVDYVHNNSNNYNTIFAGYVAAEILNFVNVVGQIFLMDRFLGGGFLTYGTEVIQFTDWDWTMRYDPMIRIFPRMTKCTFYHFGPSGSLRIEDTLCILPLNVLNEKLYVFLWFWCVVLAVLSGLELLYRVITLTCPIARLFILHIHCRAIQRRPLHNIVQSYTFGDWLLLSFMSKNMDAVHFRYLIEECARLQDTIRSNNKTADKYLNQCLPVDSMGDGNNQIQSSHIEMA